MCDKIDTMHELGYIHNDLNQDNIGINNENGYIIDFGYAQKVDPIKRVNKKKAREWMENHYENQIFIGNNEKLLELIDGEGGDAFDEKLTKYEDINSLEFYIVPDFKAVPVGTEFRSELVKDNVVQPWMEI